MIIRSILIGLGHQNIFILPLAHPLKQFAKQLGWNGEKDANGRRLLQLLGTDCGRNCIDPDIWVKHWLDASVGYDITIADDVRFENEAKTIKKNGILIHVARDGYSDTPQHESEVFDWLKDIKPDYVVNNPGPVDALYPILEKIALRRCGSWVNVGRNQQGTT